MAGYAASLPSRGANGTLAKIPRRDFRRYAYALIAATPGPGYCFPHVLEKPSFGGGVEATESHPDPENVTIYVVDNDDVNRLAVSALLNRVGYPSRLYLDAEAVLAEADADLPVAGGAGGKRRQLLIAFDEHCHPDQIRQRSGLHLFH